VWCHTAELWGRHFVLCASGIPGGGPRRGPGCFGGHIIRVLNCKQQDRKLANPKKEIYWKEIEQCSRSGRLEAQVWDRRKQSSGQQPGPIPARSCLPSFSPSAPMVPPLSENVQLPRRSKHQDVCVTFWLHHMPTPPGPGWERATPSASVERLPVDLHCEKFFKNKKHS